MATKKKGVIRLTATVELGTYDSKTAGVKDKVKKHGYLTLFKDELPLTGLKEVATTELKAVKITKGKLAGKTIYSAIDDTSATGRHFQFLYLQKAATGTGAKRVAKKYDAVQAYFPGGMSTRQIMGWVEKMPKKPQIVVTDLKTRITVLRSKNTGAA
jgi:hypothetical protein